MSTVFFSVLLGVSAAGVLTNSAALWMFTRQRFRKDFHRLLMILATYDMLVRCLPLYGRIFQSIVRNLLYPCILTRFKASAQIEL